MGPEESESRLIALAKAGDTSALERLLVAHYDRLATEVAHGLPDRFRALVSADDVLQETFVVAFREIRHFEPTSPDAFHRWLATIAKHRLLDLVKAQRAAKRGGGRAAIGDARRSPEESLVGLLELLQVNERTPSRSVAAHEAIRAIQAGLAELKDDYREALRLRYLEGLPVAETAARMQRTEHAVHMLCHRGLEQLREALGRSSKFFTRK